MIKLLCCKKNFDYEGLKYLFEDPNDCFIVEGKVRIPPCPECSYNI
jgi:hypothetical protein